MTAVELPVPCTDSTPYTEWLQLIPGVYSAVTPDGELRLVAGLRSRRLGRLTPWKTAVLDRLAKDRVSLAELAEAADAAETDTEAEAAEVAEANTEAEADTDADPEVGSGVAEFVDRLRTGGWLLRTIGLKGEPVYTVRPSNGPASPGKPLAEDRPGQEIVLSRFTVLYRDGDRMVLEHPLGSERIELHDSRAAAVIGQLGSPIMPSAVSGALPAEVVGRLLDDLCRTGLAVPAPAVEETELSRRQWSPHELWFHRRSQISHPGSSAAAYGRTQWARGRFEPLPARREPFPGPPIDLYAPDLEELRRTDPALTAVMEDRRSSRVFDDDDPLTVDELGELFYRCARIRRSFESDGVEYLNAPYPSGGSVYELEFYPVVRLAAGIAPGMYHYDAHQHRLRRVREMGPHVARLLASARASTFERSTAQVLIVISARFGRLMWTYQEMPYSLILKHVGVVYQTFYLAATAMGIAACGIGGGDGTAFTEATGLDYTTESSVGEFMLGRGLSD